MVNIKVLCEMYSAIQIPGVRVALAVIIIIKSSCSDTCYVLVCSLVLHGHGLSLEVAVGSKLSNTLDNVVISPKKEVQNFETSHMG